MSVQRAVIMLGEIELDVFQMPDGSYQLSETGCEKAANKGERSIRDFLRGKSPQALPYKGFNAGKLSVWGEPMKINGIPFELAVAYWTKEAMIGNLQAIALLAACAVEALERRADKAFAVERSEDSRNIQFADRLLRWQGVRQRLRDVHGGMQQAALRRKHPAAQVHDYLTVLIFGDTAEAARMKQLVDPEADVTIGLNHQEEIAGMNKLIQAKKNYANLRKLEGTWQEQVEKAVAKQ